MRKKILVVRFRQIGDAILSSVICKSLKETYPDSQIDYVLYEDIAPLFEKQSYIDNVIVINKEERKSPWKYLKKVWKVTRNKYDIVIDIMSTPKSELFTLFSLGAKYRIGRAKKGRGYTYTDKIPEPSDNFDKPEKFLQMLKPLEKDGEKVIYDSDYSLKFQKEEIEKMKKRMIEAGVNLEKSVIAFAINSRRSEKIYPIDDMLKIVKTCLDKYDCQGIFYYSPAEKEFALEAHKKLNNDKRIFTNIKTDSIRDLGAMFESCDMFIGNEGGPRHLAEAVDLPSLGLFNPGGSKKQWLSRNKDKHQGIDLTDIDLTGKDISNLSHEEKYRLMTPEILLEKIDEIINKYVLKRD